jgi:aarF domain-containing kinase
VQRLLTDPSPRLREALRYTIYGRNSNFDAERFIDVMEAFETFTVAAKSGGGEEMQGSRAFSGAVAGKSPAAGGSLAQRQQGGRQTRAALSFLISEQGEFFREFILDEVFTKILAFIRKL